MRLLLPPSFSRDTGGVTGKATCTQWEAHPCLHSGASFGLSLNLQEHPTLSKHTNTFPASPRASQDVTHTHWLAQAHQCSASLDGTLKTLWVQGRDPAPGLLFVPAGTSINTAFKATPLGCWPGKSSSRAVQGSRSFGWALPHDFFPYTHIYSCSCWSGINGKATSDFTALQRQGLVGTTCVSCPHQIYEIILKFINPHLWLRVLLSILFNVEKRLLQTTL